MTAPRKYRTITGRMRKEDRIEALERTLADLESGSFVLRGRDPADLRRHLKARLKELADK